METMEYRVYWNMRQRCYNSNNPAYKNYGARGINICERWLNSYSNFLQDMGKRPTGLTIERINNDFGYSPNNCKWATWLEQAKNQRKRKHNPHQTKSVTKSATKKKTNKLRTRYNHSVINIQTRQVYNNQVVLAKSLNISRQAVSFYFKKHSPGAKGDNYMFYKDYLINRWQGFNILFK